MPATSWPSVATGAVDDVNVSCPKRGRRRDAQLPGSTYRFRTRAIDRGRETSAPGPTGTAFHGQRRLAGRRQSCRLTAAPASTSDVGDWWGGPRGAHRRPGATVSYDVDRPAGRSRGWDSGGPTAASAAVRERRALMKTSSTCADDRDPAADDRLGGLVLDGGETENLVTIQVLGTADRPRVDIDGFLVGRYQPDKRRLLASADAATASPNACSTTSIPSSARRCSRRAARWRSWRAPGPARRG